MSKKMMLLALSAISAAILAVPACASALPAHLNSNPGAFTVHGGHLELSRAAGGGTTGATITGSGNLENTTTGTIALKIHGVTFGGLDPAPARVNPREQSRRQKCRSISSCSRQINRGF